MKRFIIRLDDASEYMDIIKWKRMENILDRFDIKPIVGIIPKNEDPVLKAIYEYNSEFWDIAKKWINKGWIPAIHGYEHKYETENGGLNPVNKRSEFAGLSYDKQRKKLKKGYAILKEHEIYPEIFFAPSHTFDKNTLKALYSETPIRVISDTVANDVYYKKPFYFIPQQSGKVRKLPFKTVTFCYHPNIMDDKDFRKLELFLQKNNRFFRNYSSNILRKRKYTFYDSLLSKVYFARRR